MYLFVGLLTAALVAVGLYVSAPTPTRFSDLISPFITTHQYNYGLPFIACLIGLSFLAAHMLRFGPPATWRKLIKLCEWVDENDPANTAGASPKK